MNAGGYGSRLKAGTTENYALAMMAEAAPQFSSLISSGVCGGVLIAIALSVRPSGLLPPCGVPCGMMTRSPGLTFTSLSPSQMVPVPSRIYWISLALGCRCLGVLPSWIAIVAPSTATNSLLRMPLDCLLYTSDAADDLLCVDLGGR